MEAVKFRRLELSIIEAEEVVHDDVARESGKGIGKIQRFLAGFEFLHADAEGVDVAVDDMDEVEDRAA
jgi:hypothetical protein